MTESRNLVFWTLLAILLVGVALYVQNIAVTIAAVIAAFLAVAQ